MIESLHKILVNHVGGVSYHSYSERCACLPEKEHRQEIFLHNGLGKVLVSEADRYLWIHFIF